jgi:aspartate aminotransferase-like enzyme
MITYPIPMVPGPVSVRPEVLEMYRTNYGSGDLESEYLQLYNQLEGNLQKVFSTQNQVAIMSGEGMLALWGALKSCLLPGDRVLSLATGVFGYGVADMAKSIGAEVRIVGLEYDETFSDWGEVEKAVIEFRPKMITVIHCETPSGTLNPLEELGKLKAKHGVPLVYADVVASLGGTPVLTDEWGIDLALGGSQKCLSAPPGMCFLTVSEAAWSAIEAVKYPGYDALLPFRNAQKDFYFPYTPYWHGTAALNRAVELLLEEGLEASYRRHARAALLCRGRLEDMGIELFPVEDAEPSPTVTAAYVSEGWTWTEWDQTLRSKGLAIAGSYGPLAGKVFRLGHMGTQADVHLVERACTVIAETLKEK